MKFKELHVYDLDGTLYKSPLPPEPDPVWFYHAHSLGKPQEPGFDGRWYLGTVAHARRSSLDPETMVIVLTARPDHAQMRRKVEGMVRMTGIHFHDIVLMPVLFPGSPSQFKAYEVGRILIDQPTIQRVIMYDDEQDNLDAVQKIVEASEGKFEARKTAGL